MSIEFSLQVSGAAFGHETTALFEGCRRAQDAGFAEIRVADHPGTSFDPFVLLAAIGTAVTDIRLGTYVANLGVRHPVDVAVATASLDALAPGRVTLGVGAGHTPAEWTARGGRRPDVDGRVGRLVESLDVLGPLLDGDEVTHDGDHLQLQAASIASPGPPTGRVRTLVGGSNRRILEAAGRHADVVGLTGLGRTKPDGHEHTVDWSPERLATDIGRVTSAAAGTGRTDPPVLDALVQVVDPDDDRLATATALATEIEGLTLDHALSCPYLLLGPVGAVVDQVLDLEERFGIRSYTVRPPALGHIAAVIDALP